jgi:hypothetical protein
MSVALRLAIFATCATLWVSGCLWLVLHFGFAKQTDFGPSPNPWEPLVMRVHGWMAVGGVFLLGWITAGHISERWTSRRNRVSGLALAAAAGVLVVTGYALYYTADRLHDTAAVMHELLGGGTILLALTHWWRNGRSRSARRSLSD